MTDTHIRYTYRLRPISAETTLTLLPQHLKAERGAQSFTIPYREIAAIWLSFAPQGAYMIGYRARIYANGGKKITLADTTFATFFTQERQGKQYREFITALIEHVKASNPRAQIMGGRNFWVQTATVIFGSVFSGLLPTIGIMALKMGQYALAMVTLAFAAAFIWWTWLFISRNRLRNIKAGIPDDLLPKPQPDPVV